MKHVNGLKNCPTLKTITESDVYEGDT